MIEELKALTTIQDRSICVMDDLRSKHPEKFNESGSMDYKWFESEIRPHYNIYVRHDVDSITFNMKTRDNPSKKRCGAIDVIYAGIQMLKDRQLADDLRTKMRSLAIDAIDAQY